MRRSPVVVAILLAWAVGVEAAEVKPTPPPMFVGTVHVNLVTIDAWVTGRDGAPLLGLTPADFDLLEDGKPVEITNFQPPQLLAPPAPAPAAPTATAPAPTAAPPLDPATLVFLVDNGAVRPTDRNTVLDKVSSIVDSAVTGKRARVLLATAGDSVRVRQGFTDDRDKLLATLDAIRHDPATAEVADEGFLTRTMARTNPDPSSRAGGGGRNMESQGDIEDIKSQLEMARNFQQQAYDHSRSSLAALERFVDSLAGLPGRKALFYVGNGLALNPGASLIMRGQSHFSEGPVGQATPDLTSEAHRFNLSPLLRQLVAHANANRVTFYCIDAAGNFGSSDLSPENAMMSDPGISANENQSRQFSLQLMSYGTGGQAIPNSGKLGEALRSAVESAPASYALAFAAGHDGDGKIHTIKVRVKRDGARIRFRESYLDKSPDERMADRNMAALYYDIVPNPLEASIVLGTEIPQDRGYAVPVIVHVPVGNLVLLPQGEVHEGRLSLWLAAVDDDGRVTQAPKQVFAPRIPNEKLLTALTQTVAYSFQFLMRPGTQRVAVALRDDVGLTEAGVTTTFQVPRGTNP